MLFCIRSGQCLVQSRGGGCCWTRRVVSFVTCRVRIHEVVLLKFKGPPAVTCSSLIRWERTVPRGAERCCWVCTRGMGSLEGSLLQKGLCISDGGFFPWQSIAGTANWDILGACFLHWGKKICRCQQCCTVLKCYTLLMFIWTAVLRDFLPTLFAVLKSCWPAGFVLTAKDLFRVTSLFVTEIPCAWAQLLVSCCIHLPSGAVFFTGLTSMAVRNSCLNKAVLVWVKEF